MSAMTKTNVFRAPDRAGNDSIALVLSQNAFFVTAEGDPYPGVALNVAQAREVAFRLLLFAQEIESARLAGTAGESSPCPN
jgi:hypothetical protein